MLTAAHCLPSTSSSYNVFVGVHDLRQLSVLPTRQYTSIRVIRHPDYSSQTLTNDIGILILKENVVLNSYIQLACLPDYEYDLYPNETNISAWIVGYG